MKKALVILATGFEEMEGIIIIDVLRRAGIDVCSASITEGEIIAARKTRHLADTTLASVKHIAFDIVILPGGGPGVANLMADANVKEVIEKQHNSQKLIGAICAAPNLLRAYGIISGDDPFTMFPGVVGQCNGGDFKKDEIYVLHNNILTSRGPGTTFAFALKIVELLCGKEKMEEVYAPLQLS